MSRATGALRVGTELVWDGEAGRVISWSASGVQLALPSGHVLVNIADAAAALAESHASFDSQRGPQRLEMPISGVPDEALAKARVLLRHANEVQSGFACGLDTTEAGLPARPGYDPSTTSLRERVALKARELEVTDRTVWRMLKDLPKGLLGMLDKRTIRALGIERKAAEENKRKVRAALSVVLDSFTDKSNPNQVQLRELTQRHLDREFGPGVVVVPPQRTFSRLINELAESRGTFASARTRRSIALRPTACYGSLVASRPGEYVLFDSTRLDVFALDERTGAWVRAELTVAIDLFTRAIVAFRLSHTATKAVDAALMLHDILVPKPATKYLPASGRWNYVGVPGSIVLDRFGLEDSEALAGIPVVEPETAVIDRGRVFVSDAFLGAAQALGVNVILARPKTPTDKPQVERFFRTLRMGLLMWLPGYKGATVWDRGDKIEHDAVYTLDELEAIIADWITTRYHRHWHRGLHLWSAPHVHLSPNEMYEGGLMRAGFIDVARDESILYSLLPTVWGTIQHYGFDFNGLRYDSPALNGHRKPDTPKSPIGGRYKGKWPMRYDPRDVSRIWFQDPDDYSWHAIPWHGAEEVDHRPFDESLLAYAKKLLLLRGGKGRVELADTILEILDRADAGESPKTELRAVTKSDFRTKVANGDFKACAPAEETASSLSLLGEPAQILSDEIVPFARLDFGSEYLEHVTHDEDDEELVDEDELLEEDEEDIDEW